MLPHTLPFNMRFTTCLTSCPASLTETKTETEAEKEKDNLTHFAAALLRYNKLQCKSRLRPFSSHVARSMPLFYCSLQAQGTETVIQTEGQHKP